MRLENFMGYDVGKAVNMRLHGLLCNVLCVFKLALRRRGVVA